MRPRAILGLLLTIPVLALAACGSDDKNDNNATAAAGNEFILSGYPHLEEAYRVGEGVLPVLRQRGLLDAAA